MWPPALVAGTSVFTTLFPDISPKIAMFAFLLIIVAYTFFGGFAAVCWTDFFQGLLMMAALMLVPIVVYFGHSELLDPTALETVYEYTDAATGAVTQCAFGGGIFNASWQDIVSGLGWGLGYFGMPHILVRFMSIEKPSMIKKSSIVAIIWVVISLFSAVMIAYFGRMIMGEELLTHGNQKLVFIAMSRKFFPAGICGLLGSQPSSPRPSPRRILSCSSPPVLSRRTSISPSSARVRARKKRCSSAACWCSPSP